MKSVATMLGFLLLTATAVTPAQANWFSSQKTSTMWNIGSIRNPTPQELRQHYAKVAADREAKAAKITSGK